MICEAADLFCGAGGSSSGLKRACKRLGHKLNLLAVNHWNLAIETHSANHPEARHLCETLDSVDPRKVIGKGRLDILLASPECTHHSLARGGKPIHDQSRATAWHVLRWAEALRIDRVLIENVREFTSWGPLGVNGRPLKSKKGETFSAFLNALRSLGYSVDWRIVNAANYGDPTTRERLFIMARRGRSKPTWPEQTHAPSDQADLFGKRMKPWRPARDIIDWSIPGRSIFNRQRPLAPKTIDRIAAGMRRFGSKAVEPFLVMLYGTGSARSIELPLPTITASGGHIGLCEPFIMALNHGANDCRSYHLSRPMPTITTVDAWGLVEPFLVKYHGNGGVHSLDEPLRTVDCNDRFGLVISTIGKAGPQRFVFDVRFRMLEPHELAKAMGFDDGYVFHGCREKKVKQIGNAVPVHTSEALCYSLLTA